MTVDLALKPRRRRTGAAIGVSLAVHLVVFALIGLNAARLAYREPAAQQTANIWLMPRLTPQQHKPAQHRDSAPETAKSPSAAPPARRPEAISPGGAPSAATPGSAPAAAAETGGGDAREALRTSVGCDADPVVHLTPGERDKCNQKIGEMARKAAPFMGLDPLKRGRFDDQAEADARRRADRESGMKSVVVPCEGEGSNLGGGCLSPSAIKHIPF